jgi:predicted unusual protein kinase regulating ubiquinone biosynthesis (AarF/ABC1/UbiB family)
MTSNEEETNEQNSNSKTFVKKATKLKCLSDTFQSYGGVLAKLSQIVCFEHEDSSVFSDCKPYSKDKTIKYLQNEFKINSEYFKNIKNIDFNPFKSGSVGQVHKAIYNDDKEIILKVQYVGLKEQMESDLFILDKLISYLYSFANLSNAMVDIKTKLNEELDYTLEFCNQKHIYDLWSEHENIKIAEVIPEISNEKMLGMYYIDAESLTSFIENSTQDERNQIGKYIVEFIFKNLYKEGIFYSDIHYGNFLVKDKSILYVMDFGCIHDIDDELLKCLKSLHISIINDDIELFYNVVEKLGIIDETISPKSKEYLYEYIKLQMEPWTTNNFEFTDEWLEKAVYKDVDLMKEWNLPPNMVYLNKICYGFPHVLTKLKLKGDFLKFFEELFEL